MTSGGRQLRVVGGLRGSAWAADTQRPDRRRSGLGVRGAQRSQEGVTRGQSPRMLAGRRIAARRGGERTTEAGGAVRARSHSAGALRKQVSSPSKRERETRERRRGDATVVRARVRLGSSERPRPFKAQPSRTEDSGTKGFDVFAGSWRGVLHWSPRCPRCSPKTDYLRLQQNPQHSCYLLNLLSSFVPVKP